MYLLIIIFIILFYLWFIKSKSYELWRANKQCNDIKIAKYHHINNNGKEAIYHYKKKLNNSLVGFQDNLLLLINIAKIHHYGSKNTLPDIDKAIIYYNLFLDNIDKMYLHNKYKNQYNEIIHILYDIKKVKEENTDINDYYAPLAFEYFVEDPFVEPKIKQNTRFNMAPIEPFINSLELVELNYQIEDTINIQQDPQNIHDTGINNSVSNALELLTNITEKKYSYNEIKQFILYDTPKDKLNNINKVLKQIDDCTITKNENTLKDILTLVGNNIYNSKDQEYKQTGIKNLVNELNDCVFNNSVVCFTGVHNRIAYSLNILNPNIQIKDKETLNQEMLNKASIIRNNLEKTIDSNDPTFDEKLREKIKDQLNKDYVESSILKQNQLNEIINSWINYI